MQSRHDPALKRLNDVLLTDHDAFHWDHRSRIDYGIVDDMFVKIRECSVESYAARDKDAVLLYVRETRGRPRRFPIDCLSERFIFGMGNFLQVVHVPLWFIQLRDAHGGINTAAPPWFSPRERRLLAGASLEQECPDTASLSQEDRDQASAYLRYAFLAWQNRQAFGREARFLGVAHLAMACRKLAWAATSGDVCLAPPGQMAKDFMLRRTPPLCASGADAA